ncbi:MAG: hypothetical protein WAK20_13165 [Candidatus Acidiferrum sp.]
MKKFASLFLSLFLMSGTAFADSPKDSPKAADAPAAKTTAAKPATAEKTSAEIAAEVEELRQVLQTQQEELQLLKEELAKRDKQIEDARETAASANSRATEATVKASEAVATSAEAKSTTTALNSTVTNLAASNAAAVSGATAASSQASASTTDDKGPTTIRYKGVNFTPGGFIEAATVNRTRAASADINTPFTGIPYNGNSLSKVSEMNFTARQSRVSMLVDSKVGTTALKGYFEADFLGAGTTSNNRQSNSYVFRQRQLWASVGLADGLTFSAGQMWSLATEDKKGIANLQEATPLQIDPQYVVGFTWQRAYGFRVTKTFSDMVSAAISVEGPQITVGGRGFSSYTNTSATGVVTTNQNFWADAPGSGGGLYNAFDPTGYTVNKLPDFIAKLAVDPGLGHYEVFGIFSEFRDRVYPCAIAGTTAGNTPTPTTPAVLAPCTGATGLPLLAPNVSGAYNDSRFAGGLGVSAAIPFKNNKYIASLKVVGGDGIGRYGSAQLADATARPDGTLAPIRNLQYLAKFEAHLTPKLDLYAYWGSEFDARAAYTGYQSVKITNTPAIPGVAANPVTGAPAQPSYPATSITSISTSGIGGYGSPYANNSGCNTETLPTGTGAPGTGGTCAGDVRMISEATLGFWHKIYQGEKGRLQWGIQYSYIYKIGWSGTNTSPSATQPAGLSPKGIDNMVFTSLRFYLP